MSIIGSDHILVLGGAAVAQKIFVVVVLVRGRVFVVALDFLVENLLMVQPVYEKAVLVMLDVLVGAHVAEGSFSVAVLLVEIVILLEHRFF